MQKHACAIFICEMVNLGLQATFGADNDESLRFYLITRLLHTGCAAMHHGHHPFALTARIGLLRNDAKELVRHPYPLQTLFVGGCRRTISSEG